MGHMSYKHGREDKIMVIKILGRKEGDRRASWSKDI